MSLISQFSSNLGISYLETTKQIYLREIMEYSLMLSHQETKRFDLVGWMDSNWAQNPDNYHLVERSIFEVAGSVVT